jgi:hypothetical protein
MMIVNLMIVTTRKHQEEGRKEGTTKPIYRLTWDEDHAASALMDPQIHYTLVLDQ